MMNRGTLIAQANQMLGNNIMNPQQQVWMAKPPGDSSGLAYLKPLDSLLAKQVVSLTELMTGFASQAKYGIFNDKGEQIYYAFEESDVCQRLYCPKTRQFDLHIVDSSNQEIIRIKREFKYCADSCSWCACCAGCSQEVVVESPPGSVIGYVTQQCSFWRKNYDLKDATGNVVMKIIGPGCMCDGPYACCCENKFTLLGTDGETEIGAIHKKYRGFVAEAMTSADQFAIRIPVDLDVRMKAVALGALFLIDFANFVEPPRRTY